MWPALVRQGVTVGSRVEASRWMVVSLALACAGVPGFAPAQSTDDDEPGIMEFPNLGPIPGAGQSPFGPAPGSNEPNFQLMDQTGGTVGSGFGAGRRRTGRLPGRRSPRMPGPAGMEGGGLRPPEMLPSPSWRVSRDIPDVTIETSIVDDEGPETGLTLDAAIDRMVTANLDIRGLRQELTQADADVLTAGLRTNPLVYIDSQLIPYGNFDAARPGGPTQYDVNITWPLDVSGKRQARTVVARVARTAIEAQFQDVIRRQIDNVGRAFVNLQAARIDTLAARVALARSEALLAEVTASPTLPADRRADAVDHLAFIVAEGRSALFEAEEAYDDARESLGVLLNLSVEESMRLEPRGSLRLTEPTPPVDELAALAIRVRPDLLAARRGVSRAHAELQLQRANRFDDVYLFYDPITIQDNSPFRSESATSWGVGLTFAVPVFNRNQGNIARSESNIVQTQLELSALERRVLGEVRFAEREYRRAREALVQMESGTLPRALALVDRKRNQFHAGTLTPDAFQDHIDTVAEVAQRHRESLVRVRRAALLLNTAVGLRVMP